MIEYRNGNDKLNATRKVPGLQKTPTVHLKRGVIGSTNLVDWIKAAIQGQPSWRNVTIRLQSEDHSAVVQSWKLTRALPVLYVGPTLTAAGNEVAVEELVLTCEGISIE